MVACGDGGDWRLMVAAVAVLVTVVMVVVVVVLIGLV